MSGDIGTTFGTIALTQNSTLGSTINPATVSLPTAPTAAQLDTIAFMTGINTAGTVLADSFYTWNGDNPATYTPVTDGNGNQISEAGKFVDPVATNQSSSLPGSSGGVQTFYFDPASHWTTAEQMQLADALSLWSAVANISFVETTNPATASITFVRSHPGDGSYASFPNQQNTVVGSHTLGARGATSIYIDTSVYASSTLGSFSVAGGFALQDVLHEAGHVLGLGHPGPYNDSVPPDGFVATTHTFDNTVTLANQNGPYDSRLWSAMSYTPPDVITSDSSLYPTQVQNTNWGGYYDTTVGIDDILAIQQLYGAPTGGPLSGGQVFGYNSNIGQPTPPPNGVAGIIQGSTTTTFGADSTSTGTYVITQTDGTTTIGGNTTLSFSTTGSVTTETSVTDAGMIITGETVITQIATLTHIHNGVPTITLPGTMYIGGTTVDTPATTITTTTVPISISPEGVVNSATTITTIGGHTTESFGTTVSGDIGEYYNFDVNTNPVVTLFDTGLNNTLDLSKTNTNTFINLNPGNFSSFDNLTNNIAIAYGTEIDTADGGTGTNIYVVNTHSDTINGQGTHNTVVFDEPSTAVSIKRTAANTVTVTHGATIDTLHDVQTAIFTNETLDLSTVACFVAGTHILTDRGEIAVEDLAIGDRLVTRAGEKRALRWIGRRCYAGQMANRNSAILPIRIRAGALAEGQPRRDLLVSPLHALYLDQILVPARALVNGSTIVKQYSVDQVEYFHLELSTHDIIFAEGVEAESYLDDGNRGMFQNCAEYDVLYPGHMAARPRYFAERHEQGEQVDAIWSRLADRAAALGCQRPRPYHISLDQAGLVRAQIPAFVSEVHLHTPPRFASGDRRKLGALVQRIRLAGTAISMTDARLVRGFHQVERHDAQTVRWTDGIAVVAIDAASHDRTMEIEVAELAAALRLAS